MEIGMVNLKNTTIIIQQEKRVTIMNSTVKTANTPADIMMTDKKHEKVNTLLILLTVNVSYWNITGAMYATPSLLDLLKRSDIYVITEHWLKYNNVEYLRNLDKDFMVSYTV
jgi:hypothetical protein